MVLAYSTPTVLYSSQLEKYYKDGKQIHLYEKGEEIPLLEQGVWQVYRGLVELSSLHYNGDQALLGWAKPQAFFGKWLNRLNAYNATALSDVYLIWYSLKEIETSNNLAQLMLHQVVQGIRQTENLLAIAAIKKVQDRLNEFLNLLANELGEETEEGIIITVKFTHQNIASAINSTRVTVTKMLGDLQNKGKIKWTENRYLTILNN